MAGLAWHWPGLYCQPQLLAWPGISLIVMPCLALPSLPQHFIVMVWPGLAWPLLSTPVAGLACPSTGPGLAWP
eukprot:6241770-Alexandrium_andersonii.AAC.1